MSGHMNHQNALNQQYQCHWIHKIKYNQSHDQLLLSCDSATFMNLYKFSSVSSAPSIEMSSSKLFGQDQAEQLFEFDNQQAQTDKPSTKSDESLIQRNELEDSVLDIDWSSSDAWTFAGVSYNGSFFVNTVPSKTKYEILI